MDDRRRIRCGRCGVADMPECDFAVFASQRGLTKTVSLRPGEFLFHEGDEADGLYIATRGTVRVTSASTIYEVIWAGGLVGEMALSRQYHAAQRVRHCQHLCRFDQDR